MKERNRNTDTGPPSMKHRGVNKPPIVHDNSKTISHPNEAPPVVTHKPTVRTVGPAMTKSNPGSPEQHATIRMPCKTTPTTRATCIGRGCSSGRVDFCSVGVETRKSPSPNPLALGLSQGLTPKF